MNTLQKTTGMLTVLAALTGFAHAENADVNISSTITPADVKLKLKIPNMTGYFAGSII